MAMSVAVPLRLLEDIFRLLDYLDDASDSAIAHFHEAGYSYRFERDSALWELRFKIKQLQGQIIEPYLATIGDATEDEMRDLEEWIAGGNSVYGNPYLICDDSGRPMDFINGCRAGLDMYLDPSGCLGDEGGDGADGWSDEDWNNEDLPF